MNNTHYTFTKDGQKYFANGKNRFEAQMNIELAYRVNLEGAVYEEVYKLRTVATGIVR